MNSPSGGSEYFLFSSAIVTIFAWLVPHVEIDVAEYRIALAQSSFWSGERLEEGFRVVKRHAVLALGVGVVTIVATATAVGLTTRNLDDRMVSILSGISRLMAAVILFFISYKIPKWLGIYHSVGIEFGKPLGKSVTVLSFNVRWSIFSHIFKSYFYLLPFYCGVHPGTVPMSAMIGIIAGLLITVGVYYGRTKFKAHKRYFAVGLALLLSILSAIALASGCYLIETVWGHDMSNELMVAYVTFFGWLAIQLSIHYCLWRISRREFKEMERRTSLRMHRVPKYRTELFHPNLFQSIRKECGNLDSDAEADADAEAKAAVQHLINSAATPRTNELSNEDEAHAEEVDVLDEVDSTAEARQQIAPGDEQVDANIEHPTVSTTPLDGDGVCSLGKGNEEDLDPTYGVLLRSKLCGWYWCCRRCKYRRNDYEVTPVISPIERSLRILQWIFNAVIIVGFLYLTIVNIGASTQVEAVNRQLPETYQLLYPPTYNTGEVCAFDNRGPQSNITTFPSPQAANESGFLVLHCGACGACSSWQNLEVNWKTRTNLASLSQACAKKLLFGGFDAAVQCHIDTIGFDQNCSECWVYDERCARDNCVFIYLQAVLINNVGNFKVSPGTITSATCDEAMCGPTFVPCSGATRRRMDIVSDIARPKSQQCLNVQVNWTELYGS